jgi:hypothetical protein
MVELGEVASTARYALFGPALYSLDAYDSFAEDVNVRRGGWVVWCGCVCRSSQGRRQFKLNGPLSSRCLFWCWYGAARSVPWW